MEPVSTFYLTSTCTSLIDRPCEHRNDFGIRCIIAPSFADIFRNNTMQNGMLPIILSNEECRALAEDAEAGLELEVQKVGAVEKFEQRRSELWPWLDGFGYKGKKIPVRSLGKMDW